MQIELADLSPGQHVVFPLCQWVGDIVFRWIKSRRTDFTSLMWSAAVLTPEFIEDITERDSGPILHEED